MGIWTQEERVAFGRRLAVARNAKGLTQADVVAFCEDWNVTGKGTVSAWERGGNMPSAMQVAILAKEYGVSVEWLVTGSDPWPFGADVQREAVAALPSDMLMQAKGMLRLLIAQAAQTAEPGKRRAAGM